MVFLSICHHFLQATETPEGISSKIPSQNSLRIAAFVGEEMKQYFVPVEQKVLCQVRSFQLVFLQDYILAYPDSYHFSLYCMLVMKSWVGAWE